MSAASADAPAAGAPAKRGKKKLIIIVAAVLMLLIAAGAGTAVYLKKKASVDAEAGDEGAAEHKVGKADPAHPPTFLPLDPFVVNLADKDSDKFAQIGITLEVESPAFADQVRAYMPAIRNSILLILAHKTSQELLDRAGKERLAEEIQRETVRPMGIEVPEAPSTKVVAKAAAAEAEPEADDEAEASAAPRAKKKKSKAAPPNPVRHVHFSSFIIQ